MAHSSPRLSPPDPAPRLTLVFPCYNEQARLPASLAAALAFFDQEQLAAEIIVVDDGSVDGTAEVAEATATRDSRVRLVACSPNRGKGYAVARGAAAARGEVVLFSDADLSTPLTELPRFLAELAEGYDLVIGSRALRGSRLVVRQPWWRERLGRLMNLCIRALSGLPYPDTQCGFKMFTARAARDIFPNLTVRRWMFDVEVLLLAHRLGYRVRELPVEWANSGDSRVRLAHAPNILRELLHIRWHWLHREPRRAAPPHPAGDASG